MWILIFLVMAMGVFGAEEAAKPKDPPKEVPKPMNSFERQRLSVERQMQGIRESFPPPFGGQAAPMVASSASAPGPPPPADCPPVTAAAMRPIIDREATKQKVDAGLVRAVVEAESAYSPCAVSPVGAMGLMQLMPSTASELAGRRLEGASLKDPALNSRLGALYLRQLLEQWQGNPVLAVASYNAGPGAVAHWLKAGFGNDSLNQTSGTINLQRDPELWIEAIPYPETRLYTKKVLGNLWSYRRLNQAAGAGC
jgi:soluble lytic murein transglycosylase-like protein